MNPAALGAILLGLAACDDPADKGGPPRVDSGEPADTQCAQAFYADGDGDGWGDANTVASGCTAPSGYVENDRDCDDTNPDIHPSNAEIPRDGIDQDCDGDDECTDLDCDGYLDVVVSVLTDELGAPATYSVLYRGTSGAIFDGGQRLGSSGARGNAIADINNDGWPDVVFANSTDGASVLIDSVVYWGAPTDGLSTSSTFATSAAWGVAVGDLDGDGWVDVVFANHDDGATTVVDSVIYWNSAAGFDGRTTLLPTVGASAVSAVDVDGDGWLDLIFSNERDNANWATDSYVYYGGATGFDPGRRSTFPTHGALGNAAADLNGDGFVDLVFANSFDGATHEVPTTVYWGSAAGFSTDASLDLPTVGAGGVSARDVDQDGYLDLVVSGSSTDSGASTLSYVFWGSPAAFSDADHIELPTVGAVGNSVADVNYDGWLDLIFAGEGDAQVYFGPSWPYLEPLVAAGTAHAWGVSSITLEQGI